MQLLRQYFKLLCYIHAFNFLQFTTFLSDGNFKAAFNPFPHTTNLQQTSRQTCENLYKKELKNCSIELKTLWQMCHDCFKSRLLQMGQKGLDG